MNVTLQVKGNPDTLRVDAAQFGGVIRVYELSRFSVISDQEAHLLESPANGRTRFIHVLSAPEIGWWEASLSPDLPTPRFRVRFDVLPPEINQQLREQGECTVDWLTFYPWLEDRHGLG